MKENQRLHFCKEALTDDSATLSDLNILPGAHLWVTDTGLHENRDIAGVVSILHISCCVCIFHVVCAAKVLGSDTLLLYLYIRGILCARQRQSFYGRRL